MQTEIERPRFRLVAAAACISLPVLTFYVVTLHHAVNIPTLDDYDCGLEFVTRLSKTHSFWQRFMLMIVNQHNEYRTLVSSAIFWLQYAIFGQLNFRLTCWIGDIASAGMALVLWALCLPQVKSLSLRLAIFVPAAFLIFQLNFAEAMDAPMATLQYQPALAFACFAIMFLVREGNGAFCAALGCLLLSVFSSANGFLLLPIGLVLLALGKRYRSAVIWMAVTLLAIAIYRYRYVPNPQSPPSTKPFLLQWLILKPGYMLSILGGAAVPIGLKPAILLGLLLIVVFAVLLRRGYFQRHPAMGYCVVFIVLTALGIGHIRLGLGIASSLSPRYRMYSDMLLALVWFAVAEEYILHRRDTLNIQLHRNWIYLTATAFAVVVAIHSDWHGQRFLSMRERQLISGVAAYQHPAFPGDTSGPLPDFGAAIPSTSPVFAFSRRIFADAIAHGVYSPPQYPARVP